MAAILFPVFAKAREKARQITCLSNMKELGLASQMYLQDYDEDYAPFVDVYNVQHPLTPRYSWASLLYPYIKNLQIYRCPSNPNNSLVNTLVSFSFNVSYAVNVRIHPDSWLGEIRNEAYIQEPSQKIEFGECKAQGYYEIGSHWFLISSNPSSDPWRDIGFAGHNGTFNCTFADGHAKALKPTATNAPFNMWGTYADILSNTVPFCGDYYDPNCDEPSPGAAQGLQDLENAYN